MPRPTQTEVASWRSAYDVTETQAKALVALMSAQALGYDGATTKAMRWLGLTPTEAHSVSGLQHVGLVEIFGYVEGTREAVYRATDRCFRRFGVAPLVPLGPVAQTAAQRAEEVAKREANVNKRRQRERYRRMKESA